MLRTLGIRTLVVGLGVVSWVVASASHAATWDGGGGNGNWSTGLNWALDVPPAANEVLQFGGVTNLLTNNDTAAGTQYNGIDFLAGAGAFTLGGNSVLLGGDINQNSANNQTISLPLLLDLSTVNVGGSGSGSLSLGQVTFGATVKSVNTSTLNLNRTVSATGLTLQTKNVTANAISIASGQALNVGGTVLIGTSPIATELFVDTNLNMTGGGNFNVVTSTNTNFFAGVSNMPNAGSGGNDRSRVRVDMTGLSNFVYSTGATGTGQFGVGFATRPDAQLRLAAVSNSITAATITVGSSSATPGLGAGGDNNGGPSTLFLGDGTNVLNTGNLNIGITKTSGIVTYNNAVLGSVTIQGQAGAGTRANITLANQTVATGSTAVTQLLLAGHAANVNAANVVIGRTNNTANGAVAEITFDNGTFNANSIQIAHNLGGTNAGGITGRFIMGGGALTVNNEFILGNDVNTTAVGRTDATFTINGGIATINAPITRASTGGANALDASVINLNAGTLDMTGKNIGSVAAPLTAVNLIDGNFSNAARVTGNAITLGATLNITGTPTFVLPDAGTLTSSLTTLNLPSGGGIEGNGASGSSVTGNVVAQSGSRVGASIDSTLTFNNDLALNGGSQVNATANTSPTQPSINISGALSTSGAAGSIPINVSGAFTASTTYTLVDYVNPIGGSGFSAFIKGTLPPRVTASLVDNAGNQSVDLSVTAVDRAKWTGAQSAQWSTATLPVPKNWTLVNAGGQTDYLEGDNPLFDDSATNTNVDVSVADVLPAAVEFNNSTKNYTVTGSKSIISTGTFTKTGTGTVTLAVPAAFTGAASVGAGGTLQIGNGGTTGNLTAASLANEGTLRFNRTDNVAFSTTTSGSGSVVHAGTGRTTLSGVNTYTGATNIQVGTVVVTNTSTANNTSSLGDLSTSAGSVTISNGAALDLVGNTVAQQLDFGPNKVFNVQGTGVGGTGVLTNSGTVSQFNTYEKVALTGPATFGGTGRFDIRGADGAGASLTLAGNTLTKVGPNQFSLVGVAVDEGNIVVNEGLFGLETTTTLLDSGGTKLTYNDGTSFLMFNLGGATNVTRPIEINGGVTIRNDAPALPSTFGSNVVMNGSATYTWAAATAANGITQNGVVSQGAGGPRGIEVRTSNLNNSLTLTADNTFTGSIALSGAGDLNISPTSGLPMNLASTSTVSLSNTTIDTLLSLNYTGTDEIGALLIDGVSVATGIWGSLASGAANVSDRLGGTGTLTVTSQILLPGDFDNNNRVDAADYVKWRDNAGTFNTLLNDPLSGTEVDGDQYNIWRSNFGNSIPGSGGGIGQSGQVPEPGAIVLALFAMVGGMFLRSRGA